MDNNELSTNLAEVGTDCISRQVAIRIIKNAKYPNADIQTSFDRGRNAGLEFASVIVDGLPPIQPKRGKWIDTGGNEEWYAREYRCSECGDTMLGEANFCPNCGADMRQKGENSESN